jgi:cardiolipin synthase
MQNSRLKLLVGAEEFWTSLERDISLAQEQIFIQTLSFEGDQVGQRLAHYLLSSPVRNIRVKVDSVMKWMLSDRWRLRARNLLDPTLRAEAKATRQMFNDLKSRGVELKYGHFEQRPRLIPGNHKKYILLDQRTAYIGGINICDHNFTWHDMMLRIVDPAITGMLCEDFQSMWQGHRRTLMRSFPGITFHLMGGYPNIAAHKPIFALLDQAKESIVVESAYLMYPFWQYLRKARQRGAKVIAIIPEWNNRAWMTPYMLWEAERSDIEIRIRPRMTHLKGILIDGKTMIMGSANFNLISYLLNQEVIAVITDEGIVNDFSVRVIEEDLRKSVKHQKA